MTQKTIKLETDLDTARSLLSSISQRISELMRSRSDIDLEIIKLQDQSKSIRSQIEPVNGKDNRVKIKDYLTKIVPDNSGARASEITKATGIVSSSVAFTLHNYKADFYREGKLWKAIVLP